MNAALFDCPAEKEPCQRAPTAKKGIKLINFKQMLTMKGLPWKEIKVIAYAREEQIARVISHTCMRGVDGSTPIPIRWALPVDPKGELDPLPLMSTDPLMTPERMIELLVDRWDLQVTFEQDREHLGVETQRQWSDRAIARSTPVLMALYNRLGQVDLLKVGTTAWHQKEHITFLDMLRGVRMVIWRDNLISRKGKITTSLEKITPEIVD